MNDTVMEVTARSAKAGYSRSQWAQVALVSAIWLVAEFFRKFIGISVPGSVVGLLVVWALLECRLIPLASIERGADALLNHLVLFFVPAMLALVSHPELLNWVGIKILTVVLCGTLIVMAGTVLVVEIGARISLRHSK